MPATLKTRGTNEPGLSFPKIAEPVSYFKGITSFHFEIPNNIICFYRNRRDTLGDEHHYHHRFVLLINLMGQGSLVLEGHTIKIHPMDALLIFPYQFHHFLSETSNEIKWIFITFELNHADSRQFLKNKVLSIDKKCSEYLVHFLKEYARETPNQQREAQTTAPILLSLILANFPRNRGRASKQLAAVTPPKLDQIKRYIWDNKNKDIPIKELADSFGMSESYLRQLFKKKIGISLGAYILKVRLNLAQSLLLNSNLNVSEVAYKCGYDSVYSFSRAFKKRTGFSPLAYRRAAPAKFYQDKLDKKSAK